MKKHFASAPILLLILTILIHLNGSGQMRQLFKDTDENNGINRISFYTASSGYVGFDKWIGYTTDSGKTYLKKYITSSNVDFNGNTVNLTLGFVINGIKAFNKDTLFAFGHYGLVPSILYSTNSGSSFKLVFHSQYNNFLLRTGIQDLCFPDNGKTGYAIDADRVLKTTDKGLSWTTLIDAPGNYFDHLEPVDDQTVFVINNSHNIYRVMKITNGGSSWNFLNLPANAGNLAYAHFISKDRGWINMQHDLGGRVYYTSNGGQNWKLMNDPDITPFDCHKFRFINDSTGFAIHEQYQSFKTTDSGRTWEKMERETSFNYLGYTHEDIQLLNGSMLWLGGHYGLLEMNDHGGGTPLPSAFFKIDTSGYFEKAQVKLTNYSRTNHQFEWWVNGQLISHSFHSVYTHDIYHGEDTILLIASNGIHKDSCSKNYYFVKVPYPPPTISSFNPFTGSKGTSVQIKGDFFAEVKEVSFGDIPAASFIVNSRNSITAVVGNGGNGSVGVTTATGSGSLAGFLHYPAPSIAGFYPNKGPIGTVVTINGQNFSNHPKENLVRFGAVLAEVTASNSNQLTAIVPAGTDYQLITVTVNHHTAYSKEPFSILFPSECGFTARSFDQPVLYASGSQPDKVKLADFDNDGKSDLFVTHREGFSVIRNTSEPGKISLGQRIDSTVGLFPYGSDIADLDGDGLPDLAIASSYYGNIQVYRNTSQPGFISLGEMTSYQAGTNPTSLLLRDLDNDGKPDMVLTYYGNGNNRIAIFRNASLPGMIRFVRKADYPTGKGPNFISASDLNGDGKTDLIVQTDLSFQFGIFRNTSELGEIRFAPRVDYGNTVGAAVRYAFGDFNNDHKEDLAIINNGNYSIPPTSLELYKNTSTPDSISFGPKLAYPGQTNPKDITVTDFDGDGKLDFGVASGFFNIINLYKNTGTDNEIGFTDIGSYIPFGTKGLAGGDLDGDGRPELIAAEGIFRNLIGEKGSLAGHDTAICQSRSLQLGWNPELHHSYSWSSSPLGFNSTESNPKATPIQNTWYKVEVKNPFGCLSHDSIFVNNSTVAPVADAGPDQSICRGDSVLIGPATLPTGVTASWTSWEGISSNLVRPTVSPLNSTNFFLRIDNGICSTIDTITIIVHAAPLANAGPDKNSCLGDGTFIGSSITSGNTYSWTSLPAGFSSKDATVFVNPAEKTSYFLAESNGLCTRYDTVQITPVTPPVADAGPDRLYCKGRPLLLGQPALNGLSYLWNVLSTNQYFTTAQIAINPSADLSYILKIDNGACYRRDTVLVTVIKPADAGPDQSICQGKAVTLGTAADPGSIYNWSSIPAGFTGSSYNPVATPQINTSFILQKTNGNCSTLDTVQITVDTLIIPTVAITVADTNFCKGVFPVFTAFPGSGLIVSNYQWKKNGVNVGSNQNNYTPLSLLNGDSISVVITISNPCSKISTASSQKIKMVLVSNSSSGVSIAGKTTVNSGEVVFVKASIANPGRNGQFEWMDNLNGNGWNRLNSTGDTISFLPKSSGHKLRVVYSSQNRCPEIFADTSNTLDFTITNVTATGNIDPQELGIRFYPNPVSDKLFVTGLKISDGWTHLTIHDFLGREIITTKDIRNKEQLEINLNKLTPGPYWIEIAGKKNKRVLFKIIHAPKI